MKFKHIFTLLIAMAFFRPGFGQSAPDAIRILQDESGMGARALGMGGAFTGVADDYTAIYWNPAGLADIRKSQFFGEVSHLQFNNDATFNGRLTDESQNYTRLRSLGFAFPLPTTRGSFVIALGYNRVKDFDQQLVFSGFNNRSNGLAFTIDSTDFDFGGNTFQSEQILEDGGLNQWSVAAAIALSPNFTAGVTLNAWTGNSDYQFQFFQEDRENVYNQFPADFDSYLLKRNLNTDYTAVGVKIGGMFTVSDAIKIGGTMSLPVTFNVKEVFTEEDKLTFDDGFEDAFNGDPGEFEYDVKTPFQFDGGASLSNQTITLAGSFRYRDWSQIKFDVANNDLGNSDFVELLDENAVIRQNYRATMQYNLGGELYLSGINAKLRGGYSYVPSPLKDAPTDLNKTFISGGIGFILDRFVSLDVTYLRGSWKRESEDEFTPGGTFEDITTNKVLVGLSYRF